MISTAQIRAARGLLKWTQATLAHRAALSAVTLNMIENESVHPRDNTLAAIRRALEAGGVQFLEENGIGVGVRVATREGPRPSCSRRLAVAATKP
ncbi:helix-turn-helix domain-containing protein [Lichenicoccus sp.]|uniref:helix-turn-helix domain-containing protein n=1 Tax=Lichenicoccus sp. TaxID=2781899 RepID=UPI003D10FB98